MTFDTSYHSPAGSNTHLPLSARNSPSPNIPPLAEPAAGRAAMLQRPELKSSNTLPIGLGVGAGTGLGLEGMASEHNAWADDDEEFGQEKEIEMTFA
jgi:hypothetical protein